MTIKRILLAAAALTLFASATAASAQAQDWPNRPVRIIVPFGAGGSGDALARVLSDHLSTTFGQQFVVENRTGAGGAIGARLIATAPADGYTIGITNLSVLSLVPVINKSVGYDPMAGFAHIAYVAGAPVVLAGNPKTGVKTLAEFVKYSNDKGAFTFASSGVGSDGHLMGEAIAASLPEPVRAALLARAGITGEGVLVITARRFREQEANRADARARLVEMIRHAATPRRVRRKTRVPKGSKIKRLDAKKQRGRVKRQRASIAGD